MYTDHRRYRLSHLYFVKVVVSFKETFCKRLYYSHQQDYTKLFNSPKESTRNPRDSSRSPGVVRLPQDSGNRTEVVFLEVKVDKTYFTYDTKTLWNFTSRGIPGFGPERGRERKRVEEEMTEKRDTSGNIEISSSPPFLSRYKIGSSFSFLLLDGEGRTSWHPSSPLSPLTLPPSLRVYEGKSRDRFRYLPLPPSSNSVWPETTAKDTLRTLWLNIGIELTYRLTKPCHPRTDNKGIEYLTSWKRHPSDQRFARSSTVGDPPLPRHTHRHIGSDVPSRNPSPDVSSTTGCDPVTSRPLLTPPRFYLPY